MHCSVQSLQGGNWKSISKANFLFFNCPLSTVVKLKLVVLTHKFQGIESISMQIIPSYEDGLTNPNNVVYYFQQKIDMMWDDGYVWVMKSYCLTLILSKCIFYQHFPNRKACRPQQRFHCNDHFCIQHMKTVQQIFKIDQQCSENMVNIQALTAIFTRWLWTFYAQKWSMYFLR